MDAKEAINILAKMQNYDSKRNVEALELAISALEKQVPKEPIMQVNNNRDLFCATCGARVSDVADRIINNDKLQKYCGVCGQRLDWSSDKE